jgi:hypothetical protein
LKSRGPLIKNRATTRLSRCRFLPSMQTLIINKKSFSRSWRSSGPVAKLTVICTGIVAIATVTYAVFAGWQLYEIRQGGKDTRRLADAASEQLKVMQGQLDAMTVERRPYVNVKRIAMPKLNIGPVPPITVTLFNGGKTPAVKFGLHRWIYLKTELAKDRLDRFEVDPIEKPINTYRGDIMLGGDDKQIVFTRAGLIITRKELAEIIAGSSALYFDFVISYVDDSSKEHAFGLCTQYNVRSGEFDEYKCGDNRPRNSEAN